MGNHLSSTRQIKSFVLRAGRYSKRQQEALDNMAHLYEIESNQQMWDLKEIFDKDADTVVEIGFGMGRSLFQMAQANPEINYLGIEVHRAGVGSLVADLNEYQVENVRIASHDAVEVFKYNIPDESLAGVQVFFPDPWPKKKHHKRRLIQPEFVQLLCRKLKPGGVIHCATDWEDYAHHMMDVLKSTKGIQNTQEGENFCPRPEHRPLTKFENRGKNLGHGIWDLMFMKCTNG